MGICICIGGAVAWDRGDKGAAGDRAALEPNKAANKGSSGLIQIIRLPKRIYSPSTRLRSPLDPPPLPFRCSTSLLAGFTEGSFSRSLLAFGTCDALSLGAILGVFVCRRSLSLSYAVPGDMVRPGDIVESGKGG